MKTYHYLVLCLLIILGTTIQAIELNSNTVTETLSNTISVSGHYLGIWNGFQNSNETQNQFDYGTNFDIEFRLSKTISGMFQLQMGTGKGSLGFVGPEPAVTDLNITYAPLHHPYTLTFGSFDTPFGPFTKLSNNANTQDNPHIINDIFYSSLAGPVGTLNTLGIKGESTAGPLKITLAITNGTGESAINKNSTYGTVLQIRNNSWIPQTEIGLSGIHSDDRKDADVEGNNSFATEYSGSMIHFKTTVTNKMFLDGYIGAVRYNNHIINQDDRVKLFRLGFTYQQKNLSAALQVSSWQPDNHSGIGKTSSLPNPGFNGFLNTSVTDTHITRMQATIGINMEKNVQLKTSYIYDNDEHGPKTHAIITGINGAF